MFSNLNKTKSHICVIGDLMLDKYLWGETTRVSPEAPVQVVNVKKETSTIGGAGNVARNLASMGSKVTIMSVVGTCDVANQIKNSLSKIGANIENILIEKDRVTSIKTRIISSNQQVLRFDYESENSISTFIEKKFIDNFKENVKNFDLVILSDYGKGLLTEKVTKSIIDISNSNNIKVIIDPKGRSFVKYTGSYLLTPNKKEAGLAVGFDIVDKKSLKKALNKLKTDLKLEVSMITLSEDGIAFQDKNEFHHIPANVRSVFDVTGAGDTVISALGIAISAGYNIIDAAKFANLAAGVVVGKIGSSTASLKEIHDYDILTSKSDQKKNIKTPDQMRVVVNDLKKLGRKIIFTNGCFDLLHSGHVTYLEEARNIGDTLIVGINSDRSVRSLKGATRPILNESERLLIISSLKFVDYVVLFDEETPLELIKLIQPHVLVKGSDYSNKDVIGKEYADEVVLIDFIEGKSSTNIIKKITSINYEV